MGKTEIIHVAFRDQDQVDGTLEDLWVVTEHLANPPLDAVAGDGSTPGGANGADDAADAADTGDGAEEDVPS